MAPVISSIEENIYQQASSYGKQNIIFSTNRVLLPYCSGMYPKRMRLGSKNVNFRCQITQMVLTTVILLRKFRTTT